MAFTPYVAAATPIPLMVTLLARRWVSALLAGMACITLATGVLPRALGSPSTMEGVTVRILSVNLRAGGADATTVVDLVREHDVDLLALQEFTAAAEQRLATAGLTALLPYSERHAVDGVAGSAIYAWLPLGQGGVRVNPGGFRQAHAVTQIRGAAEVSVESVHPVPPSPAAAVPYWSAGLRTQPAADTDGPLRVLIGDFNATLDHVLLRGLLDAGYRDAADAVGAGLTPTWPYFGPRAPVTPKVAIDHALVDRRIGVRAFGTFPVPRTDHRAILAELILPVGATTINQA